MDLDNVVVQANIPARIEFLPESTFNLHYQNNDLVTHVKLRVFYKGMTRDKRLFTEEFSNKLLSTLPQTPVVGYYDDEEEDFIGHNHTQFIYGYVPENAKFGFENDEDGVTWAITDIVLFTGRKDNIGKVAQKIIGKKHSLELDSESMKYSIHRNAQGELENIELTEGKFIGLSVLGDEQSPAFEGSSFFQEFNTPEFTECYKDMTENVRCFISNKNENNGGEEVNNEEKNTSSILKELNDFMRVTMDEMQQTVFDATHAKFGDDLFILQWSSVDDMVVFMDMIDGNYYRAKFNMADEQITFDEKVIVKPRFMTDQEIEEVWGAAETATNVENATEEAKVEENVIEKIEGVEEPTLENAEVVVETIQEVSSTQEIVTTETLEASGEPLNETKEEEGSFITESERVQIENDRKELEEYRKQTKFLTIEKYSKFLTEQQINSFKSKIDNYTIDSLETELSKISMQKVLKEQELEKQVNNVGSYGIRTAPKLQTSSNSDTLADIVGRYKGNKN